MVGNLERFSGISDRVMKLRVLLPCDRFLLIVSINTPILQANEEVTLAFYGALREDITKIPVGEKLIVIGDFRDW